MDATSPGLKRFLESEIEYLDKFVIEDKFGYRYSGPYIVCDFTRHIDSQSFLSLFYEHVANSGSPDDVILLDPEKIYAEIERLERKKKKIKTGSNLIDYIPGVSIIGDMIEKGIKSVDTNASPKELKKQNIMSAVYMVASAIPGFILMHMAANAADTNTCINYIHASGAYFVLDLAIPVEYFYGKGTMCAHLLEAERANNIVNNIMEEIGDNEVRIADIAK